MSWTQGFDPQWALEQHETLCRIYLNHARVTWAVAQFVLPDNKKEPLPAYLDISIDSYVTDYFSGVQPSGDEFLDFLAKRGADSAQIKEAVLSSFQETALRTRIAKEKAKEFFRLFQTEWHVLDTHVKELIDDTSIYYLIEIAISDARSTRARMNAIKSHRENHSMKADVFKWLDENMSNFKSMDSAAEAIAGKIVVTKFRAVRKWVGEWKKLRAASTT